MTAQQRVDGLRTKGQLTISADHLQLGILLLDVVDHIDLIDGVALRGVLRNTEKQFKDT